MVTWRSDKLFELDGISFRLDYGPPQERQPSSDEAFCLVKTRESVEMYLELAKTSAHAILELGMFQGGSIAFFERLFRPKQVVGIDRSASPIPALERYIAKRASVVKPYHGTSQDDATRLTQILEREFPDGVDLVVDDASHLYRPSRISFETCFPYLNPGGRYVLEDWAWSLQPGAQSNGHPWYHEPALTNLVFDWTLAVGRRSGITKIDVLPNAVIVHKHERIAAPAVLLDNEAALRGRVLQQI